MLCRIRRQVYIGAPLLKMINLSTILRKTHSLQGCETLFYPLHPSVLPCDCPSQNLVNATPPTVYLDLFETLQMFFHGLKMCMTFDCSPQIIFLYFFRSPDFVILGLKAFRHWVSCERNSSYSASRVDLVILGLNHLDTG